MNRAFVILSPPAVFILTAVSAWFACAPDGNKLVEGNSTRHGLRQRAATGVDSCDMAAALRRLESKILPHNPAPTRKTHDAEGMENAIFASERSAPCPGGGMQAFEYSMDWAKDAPEEMFAWLVGQNGKRSHYANMLFSQWAEVDIEAALAAVFKIPDPQLRAQALLTSLEVLCKTNPDRAKEILLQNMSLFSPNEASLFFEYDSGKTTWDLLLALPPGKERTHLQAELLERMNSDGLAQNLWKQASESQRREWLAAGFSPYMTSADTFEGLGEIMKEKAETSGNPADATKFIEGHGEAWAKRDLAGALDWAQAHLKGKSRVDLSGKLFQAGIAGDFDTTLRIWQGLPEGYLKKGIAEAILRAVPDARKAEAQAVLQPVAK